MGTGHRYANAMWGVVRGGGITKGGYVGVWGMCAHESPCEAITQNNWWWRVKNNVRFW